MKRAMLVAVMLVGACGGESLDRGDMHEVQGRNWEYPCPDDLDPIEDASPCEGYSAAGEAYDGEGTIECQSVLVGEFEGAVGCCAAHGGGVGYFHVCSEAQ